MLSATDPLSHTTAYEYDVQGRRAKVTDPELGETTFSYDVVGNLLTLTDPVNNTTTWRAARGQILFAVFVRIWSISSTVFRRAFDLANSCSVRRMERDWGRVLTFNF